MSGWSLEARARVAEAALWTGAAAVVLAAHAGALAWYIHAASVPTEPPPAPEAFTVALAPMPEETDLPPDKATIEAPDGIPDDEPVEDADEVPDEIVEPEPESEPALEEVEAIEPARQEEDIEEPEEELEDEEPVEEAAVPLPRPRPEPPPRRAPSQPPPHASAPAPRSAAPPRAEAEPAQRSMAPEAARGEPAPQISPAQWQRRLLAHLERHKRYPPAARARRAEGTAQLQFSIDAAGNVTAATITRSSGHPELDRAVLDMVRRASPVPAPLSEGLRRVTVPIRFSMI